MEVGREGLGKGAGLALISPGRATLTGKKSLNGIGLVGLLGEYQVRFRVPYMDES